MQLEENAREMENMKKSWETRLKEAQASTASEVRQLRCDAL